MKQIYRFILIIIIFLHVQNCKRRWSNDELSVTKKLAEVAFNSYINVEENNKLISLKQFCVERTISMFDKQGWIATEFYRDMRKAYRGQTMKRSYIDKLLDHIKQYGNEDGNCYNSLKKFISTTANVREVFFRMFNKSNIDKL